MLVIFFPFVHLQFKERRCRIKVHRSREIDEILKEEDCPTSRPDAFHEFRGIEESPQGERVRREYDRGDIPATFGPDISKLNIYFSITVMNLD